MHTYASHYGFIFKVPFVLPFAQLLALTLASSCAKWFRLLLSVALYLYAVIVYIMHVIYNLNYLEVVVLAMIKKMLRIVIKQNQDVYYFVLVIQHIAMLHMYIVYLQIQSFINKQIGHLVSALLIVYQSIVIRLLDIGVLN